MRYPCKRVCFKHMHSVIKDTESRIISSKNGRNNWINEELCYQRRNHLTLRHILDFSFQRVHDNFVGHLSEYHFFSFFFQYFTNQVKRILTYHDSNA